SVPAGRARNHRAQPRHARIARAEETPLPGPADRPAPRPNPVPQDDADRPVPRPADRYGSGPVDPDCYPPRERTG
ncbi:hypothetical protein ACFQ9Q_40820, partial [Streptomyces virginiae]